MDSAPVVAAIHFPAGDYYFSGSALPNHGTIETTQPGQISLSGVTDALISGNNVSDCPGTGIALKDCKRIDVFDNIANRNQDGITLDETSGQAHNNSCAENRESGIKVISESGQIPGGLVIKDNQCPVEVTDR